MIYGKSDKMKRIVLLTLSILILSFQDSSAQEISYKKDWLIDNSVYQNTVREYRILYLDI